MSWCCTGGPAVAAVTGWNSHQMSSAHDKISVRTWPAIRTSHHRTWQESHWGFRIQEEED